MSRTPENTTIEKPKSSLKNRAKRVGAAFTAATALGGLAVPPASAEQSLAKATNHEARQARLRNPQELPGLKIHLGAESLTRIKASTVEIGARLKPEVGGDSDGSWEPGCTAVKVSIPGQAEPFIMSAAHCFSNITGVRGGAFTDSLHPQYKAEDFSQASIYEYAVLDPQVDLQSREQMPVATVDKVSIDTNKKDVVLLHPVAADIPGKGPLNARLFEDIPAIPLSIAEKAPIQGTPVALYGEPAANGFEPIATTGVYLGRVTYSGFWGDSVGPNKEAAYRQIDLVGINPSTPEEDNCNFGTSGSMALLPNGKLLGNLSLRTNGGYGVDKNIQLADSVYTNKFYRAIWQRQLNVKLDGFSTICGYTVMDSKTPAELLDGFNHPASPVGGKGGGPIAMH